jgi:hypothetical protein
MAGAPPSAPAPAAQQQAQPAAGPAGGRLSQLSQPSQQAHLLQRRRVQQVVHQLQQVRARGLDDGHHALRVLRQPAKVAQQQRLGEADDAVERRAQLVRHGPHELLLRQRRLLRRQQRSNGRVWARAPMGSWTRGRGRGAGREARAAGGAPHLPRGVGDAACAGRAAALAAPAPAPPQPRGDDEGQHHRGQQHVGRHQQLRQLLGGLP